MRYDTRTFKGHDDYVDSNGNQLASSDPAAIHQFSAYSSNFSGLSGSLGATYHPTEKCYIKANIAKGFRAPNVAETGSNGIHDGTVVYEIGDPKLKPESSLEFDFTPGFKSKDVTAEANFFINKISNFIFAKQLLSINPDSLSKDSVNNSNPAFPNASVFLYSQTSATITGGELLIDIHPSGLRWLDWYNSYSIANVQLNNVPDSIKYIPFTPPASMRSEITLSANKITSWLNNSYFRFGLVHAFEQSNIYKQANAYAGVPDQVPVTPAYTLINIGIGSDFVFHKRKAFSLYISGNNLANTSYIDYMSRFKYYANVVNGVTQPGVSNMGRNISFRLIIPIDLKSKK